LPSRPARVAPIDPRGLLGVGWAWAQAFFSAGFAQQPDPCFGPLAVGDGGDQPRHRRCHTPSAVKDVFISSIALSCAQLKNAEKTPSGSKQSQSARRSRGHCDDIGAAEYNLALGAKRAQVAKEFLVSQGIAAERLVTISYGKEAPACFEHTEECRVQNRRARFVIFTEVPTS
jgi:hypothetical protein